MIFIQQKKFLLWSIFLKSTNTDNSQFTEVTKIMHWKHRFMFNKL